MSDGLAVKLPLNVGKDYVGYEKITNYKDLAKQNIKMILLTAPGERIMDMNYGVGLRNFLFEPNTSAVQGAVISKIQEQIGIYLPYVALENIEVSSGDHYISLLIQYTILPIGITDSLELFSSI